MHTQNSSPMFFAVRSAGIIFMVLVMIGGCIPSGMLRAQPKNFSLRSAVQYAVKNNHDLKSAHIDVSKAESTVKETFGNALPKLDLNFQYNRNLKVPVLFLPAQILQGPNAEPGTFVALPAGADNSFNSSIQLTQTVFNSAVFTAMNTSKKFLDVAKEVQQSKIQKAILNVERAYYSALLAKESVELLKQSLGNTEENFRNVKALYANGAAGEYDAIRSEVAVENLRPSVLDAEARYADAINILKVTLGLDLEESIVLTDSLAFTPLEQPSTSKFVGSALESNNDLKTIKLQQLVNDDAVEVYKAEYLPTVNFFGNYVYQGQSNTFNFLAAGQSAIGLQVQLNLFNGFRSDARVEKAKLDIQQANESFQSLNLLLKQQVSAVVNQLETARKRIMAQGRTIQQAQRGYEIAKSRYSTGVGTQIEINDAELALRQAKLNRIQGVYDYQIALGNLHQLTGTLDKEYGVR